MKDKNDYRGIFSGLLIFAAWFTQASVVLPWLRFDLELAPLATLAITFLPLTPDLWSFYAHFVGTKHQISQKAMGIWAGLVVAYTCLVIAAGENITLGPIWTKYFPENIFWATIIFTLVVRVLGGMVMGMYWRKQK